MNKHLIVLAFVYKVANEPQNIYQQHSFYQTHFYITLKSWLFPVLFSTNHVEEPIFFFNELKVSGEEKGYWNSI